MTRRKETLSDRSKPAEQWGRILYTAKKMGWWIIGIPAVLIALQMSPGMTDPCGTAKNRLQVLKEKIVRSKNYPPVARQQPITNAQSRVSQLEFEKYLACQEWKNPPLRKE